MRTLLLNLAALFTMVVAPLFAQEGELKSVLVEDDVRPLVDLDHPDPPEPKVRTEQDPGLVPSDDFPAEDEKPNPIPGLEPISVPEPRSDPKTPKSLVDARPKVRPQPVASPIAPAVPELNQTAVTMSGIGFSLVPDADVPKVRGVIVNGLAQRSGLKPGDLISAINGTPTKTPADVARRLAALNADEFDVDVIRGIRRQSIRVRLAVGDRPTGGRPIPIRRASGQPQQRLTNSSDEMQPVPPAAAVAQPTPATPYVVQQPRAVQPRTYARRPVQPARPLIGDGGRLIGNGRVINSVRRIFRW